MACSVGHSIFPSFCFFCLRSEVVERKMEMIGHLKRFFFTQKFHFDNCHNSGLGFIF